LTKRINEHDKIKADKDLSEGKFSKFETDLNKFYLELDEKSN